MILTTEACFTVSLVTIGNQDLFLISFAGGQSQVSTLFCYDLFTRTLKLALDPNKDVQHGFGTCFVVLKMANSLAWFDLKSLEVYRMGPAR